MRVLPVTGLPEGVLAAAADFHARVLPALDPHPDAEDLLLVLPPADHTHHGWRLAAVQQLARDLAPLRINAVAADDDAAIAAAARYLADAPGLTGQLLVLDITGAGPVVG